jgi:hypothetical protein
VLGKCRSRHGGTPGGRHKESRHQYGPGMGKQ